MKTITHKVHVEYFAPPEVDVVDVAAGAVGHETDEGRVLAVGAEELLDAISEEGEVIGRDVPLRNTADVVE